MPPNNQASAASNLGLSGQRAPTILRPGNIIVKDQNGKLTDFGGLAVVSSLDTALSNSGVCIGLYGRPGVGKTTLACQLANPFLDPMLSEAPVLLLDAEGGIHSVAHLLGDNLQQITLTSFAQLRQFVDACKLTAVGDLPWRTIVVDNLTDIANKCLKEIGYAGAAAMVSGLADYNKQLTLISDVVSDLRDLALTHGINIVLSLWETQDKTDSGIVLNTRADLPPKLANRIHGILTYVGYLSTEKPVTSQGWTRKLDFSENPNLAAKWRVRPMEAAAQIPRELWNPNLVDIFNTIKRGASFQSSKYAKPATR